MALGQALVLVFLAIIHITCAKYEWTGTEWRWVDSQPNPPARGPGPYNPPGDDFGSGEEPDEEDEEGQEPPSGRVENMELSARQNSITVTWQPPDRETWNSCLLGYRVGHVEMNPDHVGPWQTPLFETVEGKYEEKESGKNYFFEEVEGSNHTFTILNLSPERTYRVSIQVFNPWGKNLMLTEQTIETEPGVTHPKLPLTPSFQSPAWSRLCPMLTTL